MHNVPVMIPWYDNIYNCIGICRGIYRQSEVNVIRIGFIMTRIRMCVCNCSRGLSRDERRIRQSNQCCTQLSWENCKNNIPFIVHSDMKGIIWATTTPPQRSYFHLIQMYPPYLSLSHLVLFKAHLSHHLRFQNQQQLDNSYFHQHIGVIVIIVVIIYGNIL